MYNYVQRILADYMVFRAALQRCSRVRSLVCGLLLAVLLPSSTYATTTRVTVDSLASEANSQSNYSAMSSDGRYIYMDSSANNLITGDANAVDDVFKKDTVTGLVNRLSRSTAGVEGGADSATPSTSADGQWVAFYSLADNLVSGDTNASADVFLHDTLTNTTTRMSTDTSGTQANGPSSDPVISANGQVVVFYSGADNLVPGDSNLSEDIYAKDISTGITTRVSTDSSGNEANSGSILPSISADGRFVTFMSNANNLVVGDSNDAFDVFQKDTQTGVLIRISTDSSNSQADGDSFYSAQSSDGRFVVFLSEATNLVGGDTNGTYDAFVKDTLLDTLIRVSTSTGGSEASAGFDRLSMNVDGRYVAFVSDAATVVSSDTNGAYDVFVNDSYTNTTIRVSEDSSSTQGNGASTTSVINGEGTQVAYRSFASNLVASDNNTTHDIFVSDNTSYVPDSDGDGLRDDVEADLGTDAGLIDTDGDGVSDYAEVTRDFIYSDYAIGVDLDPTEADTDGDGFDDGVELSGGSDPLNAASTPSGTALSAYSLDHRSILVLLMSILLLGVAFISTQRKA